MVNTFVVDADPVVSATQLDDRRLNKQIIEAAQILTAIKKAYYIASGVVGCSPLPPPPAEVSTAEKRSWVAEINTAYVNSMWLIEAVNDEFYLIPRPTGTARRGIGWLSHPATVLWIGYEAALGEYINIHLHEWLARGKNNTRRFWDITTPPEWPPWSRDERWLASHRSALLHKELTRSEAPWYVQRFASDTIPEVNYLWDWPLPVESG